MENNNKLTAKKRNSIILECVLPRFLITCIIVLFIRSGTFIPVPVIHHDQVQSVLSGSLPTQNLLRTFLGGNSIIIGLFTLNIFPAINASIFIQFLFALSPELGKLQKEGDFAARREISFLNRRITLFLAVLQGIGIALYLRPIIFNWSYLVAFQIIIWLTAGAMIVLWLSEVITEYGLGNGTSVLVYVNIISNLPNIYQSVFDQQTKVSNVSPELTIATITMLTGLIIYAIVLLQSSTFRINLISAKRLNRIQDSDDSDVYSSSYIPLRFNQAGVMPIILTTSFLVLPNYIVNSGYFSWLRFLKGDGFRWIYWVGYIILIFVFSLFYSTLVLNPKDISDNLQRSNVKICGVRPGVQTTYYLKQEMKRITLIGTSVLAFITIIPNLIEILLGFNNLSGLSTTSILILGGVILDIRREVDDILLSERYRSQN